MRTITRHYSKLRSVFYFCHIFINFILHSPLFFTRRYCFYLFRNYIELDGYYLSMWIIQLTLCSPIQLLIFCKFLQKGCKKAKIIFYLLCISKEESRTVNYGTRQYRGSRGRKGPRRRTKSSELLDFEEAARLRQQSQFFCLFSGRPAFKITAQKILIQDGQPGVFSDVRQHFVK